MRHFFEANTAPPPLEDCEPAHTRAPTGGLFVNEQQMAARLGFTVSQWKLFRPDYTRHGLPAADPVSGMRYWPAVKAFFDNLAGIGTSAVRLGFVANGEENPDALRRGYRKNAR